MTEGSPGEGCFLAAIALRTSAGRQTSGGGSESRQESVGRVLARVRLHLLESVRGNDLVILEGDRLLVQGPAQPGLGLAHYEQRLARIVLEAQRAAGPTLAARVEGVAVVADDPASARAMVASWRPGSRGPSVRVDRRSSSAAWLAVPDPEGMVLVGRQAELAVLERALEHREEVAGVVVAGVPGSGKSLLVRRFLEVVPPGRALLARPGALEATRPYATLAQLLAVEGPLGHVRRRAGAEAEGSLLALELADALASGGPWVICVDDLHRVDPRSATVLQALLRAGVPGVLFVLTTLGSGALGVGGWGHALAGRRVRTIELGGLEPQAVEELARLRGVELREVELARLMAATGGHPLHVDALIRQARWLGRLELGAPSAALATVEATVRECLGRLDPAAVEVVEVASVLGSQVGTDVLAAVLESLRPGAVGVGLVERWVAEAIGAFWGLIVGATGLIAFRHELIRDAVRGSLDEERRRAIHRAAALVLGGETGLAHAVAAASSPDPELVERLVAAAEAALAEGVASRAADLLRDAIEVGGAGDRVVLARTEALLVAGRAIEAYDHEQAILAMDGSPMRDYVLGYLRLLSGKPQEARALLERAWAGLAHQPEAELGPRVASQLAVVHLIELELEEAQRSCTLALAHQEALPPATRVFAEFVHVAARALQGDLGVLGEQADGLARTGQRSGVAEALIGRAVACLWLDRLEESERLFDQFVASARAGDPMRVSQALALAGECLYRRGRVEEACRLVDMACFVAVEQERFWDLPMLQAELAQILLERAEWVRAEERAGEAMRWAEAVGHKVAMAYALGAAILVAFAKGANDEALALAERFETLERHFDPGCHALGPVVAEAWVRLGHPERAHQPLARYMERARARGRRSAIAAGTRTLGLAEVRLGHLEEAARLLAQASWEYGQLGWRLEELRTELLLVRLDAERGRRAAVRARATALAGEARDLGAVALELEARSFLGELAPSLVGPRTSRMQAVLSQAEVAVARVVVAGASNAEVARALDLSVKTVEAHLSRVYAKLGVASRRELVERFGPTLLDGRAE